MCGCNLGCRRRRRPSGLRLVAITCIVVRMMVNSRRHQGRKAYAPTRRGIIINRAVSASLAALRAMTLGSRPMLSGTKGGLRPGAAPGCNLPFVTLSIGLDPGGIARSAASDADTARLIMMPLRVGAYALRP